MLHCAVTNTDFSTFVKGIARVYPCSKQYWRNIGAILGILANIGQHMLYCANIGIHILRQYCVIYIGQSWHYLGKPILGVKYCANHGVISEGQYWALNIAPIMALPRKANIGR